MPARLNEFGMVPSGDLKSSCRRPAAAILTAKRPLPTVTLPAPPPPGAPDAASNVSKSGRFRDRGGRESRW